MCLIEEVLVVERKGCIGRREKGYPFDAEIVRVRVDGSKGRHVSTAVKDFNSGEGYKEQDLPFPTKTYKE